MGICSQNQSESWLEIFWAHRKLSPSPLETSQFQSTPSHLTRSPSNSILRSLPSQPQFHTPPVPKALSKPHQILNPPNSIQSRCAPSLSLSPTPHFQPPSLSYPSFQLPHPSLFYPKSLPPLPSQLPTSLQISSQSSHPIPNSQFLQTVMPRSSLDLQHPVSGQPLNYSSASCHAGYCC